MARIQPTRYAIGEEDALWFGGVAGGNRDRNQIEGTAGDDVLKGTSGPDDFHVEQNSMGDGGDDILRGGAGDDKFFFGVTYTDKDTVYGGVGNDRLILGQVADGVIALNEGNIRSVESIKLNGGTYNITVGNGLDDLKSIFVNHNEADLFLDASAATTGLRVLAGGAAEVLIGGSGDDVLIGSGGADRLTGGLGRDVFEYRTTSESTTKFFHDPDTITDFEKGDKIRLPTDFGGASQYHIGATDERVGDVVFQYDAAQGQTLIDVYTDSDETADMTFILIGNFQSLEIHGLASIVC